MLQAVGHIGHQEPCIGISQEVVDAIPLWDRAVVLQGVDIVVGSRYAQIGFQQAGCSELQCWRDDQFFGLCCDQKTALISPSSDLNNCVFQRSFVQISGCSRAIAVGSTRHQRVCSRDQRNPVTAYVCAAKSVVQDGSTLDLLGVRHCTGQSLGVTGRQRVIQVVFNSLFSDGEAKSDSLVVVPSRKRFLCIVISNGRTLVLDWCSGESRQLGLFFKRTL